MRYAFKLEVWFTGLPLPLNYTIFAIINNAAKLHCLTVGHWFKCLFQRARVEVTLKVAELDGKYCRRKLAVWIHSSLAFQLNKVHEATVLLG